MVHIVYCQRTNGDIYRSRAKDLIWWMLGNLQMKNRPLCLRLINRQSIPFPVENAKSSRHKNWLISQNQISFIYLSWSAFSDWSFSRVPWPNFVHWLSHESFSVRLSTDAISAMQMQLCWFLTRMEVFEWNQRDIYHVSLPSGRIQLTDT